MHRSGASFQVFGVATKVCLLSLVAAVAAPGVARAQNYIQQIQGVPGTVQFGHVLAVDQAAATLVVGDPQAPNASCVTGYGAVKIYKLSGGTWTLNQTLTPPAINPSTGAPNQVPNMFGNSVSIRNNVLVVSSQDEDAATSEDAGAIYVYRRTSPTAQFGTTPVRVFAPNPIEDEFTRLGGVATNGTYIAAADGILPGDPDNNNNQIQVYQVQGTNIVYMTTIPAVVDVNATIANLYITNTNALVISTWGEFTSGIIAFQLNGTQATPINTGATAETFTNMLPYIAGDGNTVLAYKLRQPPPPGVPVSFLQIIKFNAAGVASFQDIDLPVTYNNASPASGGEAFPSMTVRENQGIFIGYNNVEGQNAVFYNFVTGYRYQSSTGLYYPSGVVRNDVLAYPNTSFAAAGMAYDGTYLFVGDAGQGGTGSGCSQAKGAVDVLRPITTTATGPSNTKQLASWMNQLDYQMGTVVATNGTYVLSGSQLAGDAVSYPGALTLFESINSQWQQVDRYIDANTGGFGTLARAFAFSADISSNALAVGAPIALTGAGQVNTGTVFASTSIFPVGPFLTEVDPPASVPGWSLFGWSVAVTGTTMVVGAPASANVGGTGIATRGAAYVYTLSSGSWTLTQTLQPTPMSGNDHEGFGTAVDASGSNIIVGIPSRTVAGKLALGAVQIFTLVNGQYISGGNFNGPTTLAANAQFGNTVSIGADYAVAGSRNAGTVVVYQRNGNSWAQAAVIAPGPAHFGAAVALEGTRFAAGSPSEDRVYRYERINSAWQLTGTISSPNPTLTFGSSLDIKNSTLVIGDPNATTGTGITTNSGAAYVVPITGF